MEKCWNFQLLTSDNHDELRGDHPVARRLPRLEPRGVSEAFNSRWLSDFSCCPHFRWFFWVQQYCPLSNIPPRYGNVTHSRLPWDSVWSPDVILHNPAGSSIILSRVDGWRQNKWYWEKTALLYFLDVISDKASDVGIKYIFQVMVNREKSCEHLFRWRFLYLYMIVVFVIVQPSDRLPGQRHTSHSIDVHEQMQGAWRKLKRLHSIYISAG